MLENGFGSQAAPVFDRSLTVETDLLDAKTVTADLEVPEDAEFCARFTATNELGSVSTEPRCFGALPSGLIVEPAPADSASPSAAP